MPFYDILLMNKDYQMLFGYDERYLVENEDEWDLPETNVDVLEQSRRTLMLLNLAYQDKEILENFKMITEVEKFNNSFKRLLTQKTTTDKK